MSSSDLSFTAGWISGVHFWENEGRSDRRGDKGRREVAGYYADLTRLYEWYGGDAHGWHFGVWDPGVAHHRQALGRSNELLLEGLAPGPETRILDVGFGSGGFATWAAATFGCRVTGITVCREHVPLASTLARSLGVEERCRFLVMDMDELAFGGESFNVVVNQETLCHSCSKSRYLAQVFRILEPGGFWRAVVFSLQATRRSRTEEWRYRRVREGFHIPSLNSEEEVRAMLSDSGFHDIRVTDLTERVRRTAANILWFSRLPELLMPVGLGRLLFPLDRTRRQRYQGHVAACSAYARGLQRGPFRHLLYSARKPVHAHASPRQCGRDGSEKRAVISPTSAPQLGPPRRDGAGAPLHGDEPEANEFTPVLVESARQPAPSS